jgi:hypothetical protein
MLALNLAVHMTTIRFNGLKILLHLLNFYALLNDMGTFYNDGYEPIISYFKHYQRGGCGANF